MPQYHNWFQHIRLGNTNRRSRDRQRKRNTRGNCYQRTSPALADYHAINRAAYQIESWGGAYPVKTYDLRTIATIYKISNATVYRWYRAGMMPEPAYVYRGADCITPIYIGPQLLAICWVLNDVFSQSSQYRQNYVTHIAMMKRGADLAMECYQRKLAREPKKPARILPPPKEWPELRAKGYGYRLSTSYNPIASYEDSRYRPYA